MPLRDFHDSSNAIGSHVSGRTNSGPSALTEHRARHRLSMEGKCVLVDYEVMMNRYIPAPEAEPPPPAYKLHPTLEQLASGLMKEKITERKMYEPLSITINNWLKRTKFKLFITDNKQDSEDPTKRRIDGGIYKEGEGLDQDSDVGVNWDALDARMEVKRSHTLDPFSDKVDDVVHNSVDGRKALGQIMSYSSLSFIRQHRTHQFSLLILGVNARIIRWDRSGASVTKAFNYFKHPEKLGEFIWRYAHMTDAQRGHDTTVERILSNDEENDLITQRANIPRRPSEGPALDEHIRKLFQKTVERGQRYKMHVGKGDDCRSFLVGKPHTWSTTLAGRGTRGYIAIDSQDPDGPFVFLKDTWRVATDHLMAEGAILEILCDAAVKEREPLGIPTLVCHGDVDDQETDTQNLWKVLHPKQECPLRTHRHYRLVVKEVGLPIEQFSTGHEMISLIIDAIVAHEFAYRNDFIHRDISVRTVLIFVEEKIERGKLVVTRRGLLTDWELAKRISEKERRQQERTFLSVNILNNHGKAVEVAHEMESFFHLIIWLAIQYLPHNHPDVQHFVTSYFDAHAPGPSGPGCGATKRLAMQSGSISFGDVPLTFYREPKPAHTLPPVSENAPQATTPIWQPTPHPINAIINVLLSKFQSRYALLATPPAPVDDTASVVDPNAAKGRHSAFFVLPKPNSNASPTRSADKEMRLQTDLTDLQKQRRFAGLIHKHARGSAHWPSNDKTQPQFRQPLSSSVVNAKRTYETMIGGGGSQDRVTRQTRSQTRAQTRST